MKRYAFRHFDKLTGLNFLKQLPELVSNVENIVSLYSVQVKSYGVAL